MIDILGFVEQWINENFDFWTSKGFIIIKNQPSVDRDKNSIAIDVTKDEIVSTIIVWDSGECDILQIETDNPLENKFFKNVIITSREQLFWELENFLQNFDTLKGSSVDPLHK